MKIVVAKYKEDISWTKDIKDHEVIVIDKHLKELSNFPGREAHTYLHYILTEWDNLEGYYVFCQGNPFDHCKTFLEQLEPTEKVLSDRRLVFDKFGKPAHKWEDLDMTTYWLIFNDGPIPDELSSGEGAQFIVHADTIKNIPLKVWGELYKRTLYDHQSGYILERLWSYLLWKKQY